MHINRAERIAIGTIVLALLVFGCNLVLQRTLNYTFEPSVFSSIHLSTEFIGFAVCFSIVVLGGLFFLQTLTCQRLYIAALFVVIGGFDLGHALSFEGMPFYLQYDGQSLSVILGVIGQMIVACGLLFIFCLPDRHIAAFKRWWLLGGALLLTAIAISCVYFILASGWLLPAGLSAMFVAVAPFAASLVLGATLILILYRNRRQRPPAMLTIVQALVFLALSFLQHGIMPAISDGNMLLAHLFKLAGYLGLMVGIYYVTVEEPYRQQKQAEERVRYLAYHDELTGLSNRRLLADQLNEVLVTAHRHNRQFAVLLLDIDRFKVINDTLGHSYGDRILVAVSQRLRHNIAVHGSVFRMGGDEFAIVLPGIADPAEATAIAQMVMRLFDRPIWLENEEYHITVSLGISLFPQDGENVELMVKNAETAMYRAKQHRNEYKIYESNMNERASERLQLERDMRKAIERQQFVVMYQPLVQLETGKVVGVEALVRWLHPKRGLVYPGEFISLAEETGLIVPLGEWVMRTACLQNKEWQEAGLPPITVSVNLSMRQFRQHQLVEGVKQILEETGLPPQYLELEITESMTADVEHASRKLQDMKQLGVKISIDDFGTGYSSLLYLKKFPIDKLKIDRSFVSDLLSDGNDAAIVTTIAAMARHMNLKVTAEGVEDIRQIEFLREQKCEEAQGYYFTRPIPAKDIQSWLEKACIAV